MLYRSTKIVMSGDGHELTKPGFVFEAEFVPGSNHMAVEFGVRVLMDMESFSNHFEKVSGFLVVTQEEEDIISSSKVSDAEEAVALANALLVAHAKESDRYDEFVEGYDKGEEWDTCDSVWDRAWAHWRGVNWSCHIIPF